MWIGLLLIAMQGLVALLAWKLSEEWGQPGRSLFVAAMGFMVHRRVLALQVEAARKGDFLEHLDRQYVPLIISGLLLASMLSSIRKNQKRVPGIDPTLSAVMTSSKTGIALVSFEGAWLYVNPILEQILGRSAEELRASTFQDITHPEDLGKDMHLVGQVVNGVLPGYSMHKRYIKPDGSVVYARLTVTVHTNSVGKPICFVSQIEDKTAEHLARERASDQYEALRQAHDALSERYDALDENLSQIQESELREAMAQIETATRKAFGQHIDLEESGG